MTITAILIKEEGRVILVTGLCLLSEMSVLVVSLLDSECREPGLAREG